jgi:hypothetical protein
MNLATFAKKLGLLGQGSCGFSLASCNTAEPHLFIAMQQK